MHRRATAAMVAAATATISLVDWASFEVMRERGIERALAFDDDFATHGFQLAT